MEPPAHAGRETLKIEPMRSSSIIPLPASLSLFLSRYLRDAYHDQNTIELAIDWEKQQILITEPSPALKAPAVTVLPFEEIASLTLEKQYSGRYNGYVLGAIFVMRNQTLKGIPLSATHLFRFEQLSHDLNVPLRRI